MKLRIAAAVLAILALGIGVTTWALIDRATADLIAERQAVETSEAVRTARQLERKVIEMQRALRITAAALPVERFAEIDLLHDRLRGQPLLLGQFDTLFVAGLDGQIRLFHERGQWSAPPVNIADREYFRTAVGEARPTVSPMLVGRVSTQPVVVLTQPITLRERVVGVIGGALRVRERDLLIGPTEPIDGDEGQLVVVTDLAGMIIAHTDTASVGLPLSSEPQLAAAVQRWREKGMPFEPAGVDLPDAERVTAAAAAPGAQWLVWRSRRRADLLAPIVQARHAALRWAAASSAMLGVALLCLLWWQFRPLERLQARALALLNPDADPAVGWPVGNDEVGTLAALLRDVATERARLEQRNAVVLRQLTAVMAAAPIGIAFTRERRFEVVSPQFCRLLGRGETDLIGCAAQTIYASNEDYLRLGPLVGAAFGRRQPYVGEWEMLRGDGTRFWARLRGQPVDWEDAGAGTIWAVDDISDEIDRRRSLEWSATHDALTGLANRNALIQQLDRQLAGRPLTLPTALLLLDLDRFKPVNDQHGHAAGDAVLKAVAHAALGCIRGGDLMARLGGDEFAVLLERCPADVATRLAEELRTAIAGVRVPWGSATLGVGVSIGVAALSDAMPDHSAWLAAADSACYDAKAAGRGIVRNASVRPLRAIARIGGNGE